MSRGKNNKGKMWEAVHTEEANTLMNTYRDSVLPTPVLLWRTDGKTVAAWELSQEQWGKVAEALGIEL